MYNNDKIVYQNKTKQKKEGSLFSILDIFLKRIKPFLDFSILSLECDFLYCFKKQFFLSNQKLID